MEKSILRKKYLLIIVLLILATTSSYLFLRQYQRGRLVITTSDNSAVISLFQNESTKSKKIGKGKVDIHLSKGKYIIEATKQSDYSRMAVTIQARKTTIVALELQPQSTSSIVTHDIARGIKVTNSGSVLFLNAPYHQLFQYLPGADRTMRYRPEIYPISRVDWLSNGGAILSIGSSSVSYFDPSGNLSSLDTDLSTRSSSYAVSSSGSVAFLSNNQLMIKKSPVDPPLAIMLIPAGSYNLSISDDGSRFFVYADLSVGDAPRNKSSFVNYVVSVSSPKKFTSFKTNSAIGSAVWSNDNHILAYTIGSDIHTYNLATQKNIDYMTDLQKYQVTLAKFIDNKDLIYAQNQALWKLNTENRQSFKVSSYQGSFSATSFTFGANSKIFYYSTDPDSSGGGQIYQIVQIQ